jgi:hypothetical protein
MKLMKKVSDQLIGSYVEFIHIQNCLEFQIDHISRYSRLFLYFHKFTSSFIKNM